MAIVLAAAAGAPGLFLVDLGQSVVQRVLLSSIGWFTRRLRG